MDKLVAISTYDLPESKVPLKVVFSNHVFVLCEVITLSCLNLRKT